MAVTSYRFAGTIVSETISGGNATDWSNPSNAGADDTSYATLSVSTASSDTGAYLKFTDFGFTSSDIPSGSTIDGIEVEQARFEGSSTDNIFDLRLRAVKGGAIHTANVSNMSTGEWGVSPTVEVLTAGGATNLWGLAWLDTDITSSGFGFAWAPNLTGTTPDASVDYLKARIYYTPPSNPTGAGASTEASDTASASGLAGIRGGGASTEANDSASGVAKETFTGAGVATESADTASGAGRETFTGAGASAEDADSASAAGIEAFTGAGAAQEDSDSSSGAGSSIAEITGIGTSAEDDDGASSSGAISFLNTIFEWIIRARRRARR